jgi:hypothetical protein
MDEGLPIAYLVLERDVPVYAAGSEFVGTVDHVVAAPEEDIFHGIVMATGKSKHFVAAELIDSLHEHGVDLTIDQGEVAALPAPHGGAPVFHDNEPGVKGPSKWKHFVDIMDGRAGKERWTQER